MWRKRQSHGFEPHHRQTDKLYVGKSSLCNFLFVNIILNAFHINPTQVSMTLFSATSRFSEKLISEKHISLEFPVNCIARISLAEGIRTVNYK